MAYYVLGLMRSVKHTAQWKVMKCLYSSREAGHEWGQRISIKTSQQSHRCKSQKVKYSEGNWHGSEEMGLAYANLTRFGN